VVERQRRMLHDAVGVAGQGRDLAGDDAIEVTAPAPARETGSWRVRAGHRLASTIAATLPVRCAGGHARQRPAPPRHVRPAPAPGSPPPPPGAAPGVRTPRGPKQTGARAPA